MKTAVIFDMDGTVIDSSGSYDIIKYEVIEDMGYSLTPEEFEILDKFPHLDFPREFNKIKEDKLDESLYFHFVNTRVRENYREGFKLKKGIVKFLDYLDENDIKYCIATASRNLHAISTFDKLNMIDRFEFIISTSDVDRSKEYPTIYKEAAIMMGANIEDTFVFEDALYAVKSAKKGNFKTVGIYDKYFEKDQEQIKEAADYYIKDYDDLMQQIENSEIIIA